MRLWNLGIGDPLFLTIAADARFCRPDYANDHIWELSLGGGEMPALALQTTYGLRAQWMRLFPLFARREISLIDPRNFHQPPRLEAFYPNYLAVSAQPFAGLAVRLEYWVVDSHHVAGRLQVSNQGEDQDSLHVEWSALLSPMRDGAGMILAQMGMNHILQGQSENLHPILFVSGGPQPGSGPYPGLGFDLELHPGEQKQFTWALAALSTAEESLKRAREAASRNWDAEIARIEMQNAGQEIEITTGDPDWDAAFALSQAAAYQSIFHGGQHLPFPSFVLSRQPDHGHSMRGNGSDYTHLWNGQLPLDAYYLTGLLLPGGSELAAGLLHNFLHTQDESGFIDLKPGLGGQRAHVLAMPILATLALKIAEQRPSPSAWLAQVYPALLRFVRCWFSAEHDRDQDGFPEWEHPLQTGLEDNPLFDRWQPQSQGVEVTTIECPTLAALLYRECQSLIQIAGHCDLTEDLPWLQDQAEKLKGELESTWDRRRRTYRCRDFQTHLSPSGSEIFVLQGSGVFRKRRSFRAPARLLLQVESADQNTRPVQITLNGENETGKLIEKISARDMSWTSGRALFTTKNLYRKIERIEIQGLTPNDRLVLRTADYTQEYLALLLPLWAAIPDHKQAQSLIESALPRYLTDNGLSNLPLPASGPPATIHLPWNCLLAEALLAYGYRQLAADLFTRMMGAVIHSLKQERTFRAHYPPSGERNSLRGLLPLGLFLQILGLQIRHEHELVLDGFNPFPRPITVKYRGTIITRHHDDTVVTFHNGKTVTINGPGPHLVKLPRN